MSEARSLGFGTITSVLICVCVLLCVGCVCVPVAALGHLHCVVPHKLPSTIKFGLPVQL